MKKIIIGILCLVLMTAFAGCRSDPDNIEAASYGNNDGNYQFSLSLSTGEVTAAAYAQEETNNAMTVIPAVQEGFPSEPDTTADHISGDSNFTDTDTTQISAGRFPEPTETVEMHTSYTSKNESPSSFTNPWETTANSPREAEAAAKSAVSSGFSARIAVVKPDSVIVEILSDEWFDIFGSYVEIDIKQLEDFPDCSAGDYAEITVSGEIKTSGELPTKIDSGIGQIKVTEHLDIDLPENSVLAKVLSVYEPYTVDYYVLTVKAFDLKGYYFGAEIFISAYDEFAVGDWVKIDFTEDRMFMESSPMQVDEKYISGIEKV